MRVLITGTGGQLGRDLTDAFSDHDVIACDRAALDVGDRDAVLQAITTTQPDAVVHAAAWTAVDACESDPDRALRVNALGTRHVADACRRVNAAVCYVSTDYVFDGTLDRPYNEWDVTNPQSVYGRSKRAGEMELDAAATIVRTSWVVGPHGKNFVKTMLRLAAERDTWGVVDDQHGCPTFTGDLAAAIRQLVVARLPGTFHVTNQGPTSWFEFARAILSTAGLDPERINPITSAEYPVPAPRPANSVLDNAALRLTDIPLLADWHEALERTVKELSS